MSVATVIQKLEQGAVIVENDSAERVVENLRTRLAGDYIVLDPVHGPVDQTYFILPAIAAMRKLATEVHEHEKFYRGRQDDAFMRRFDQATNAFSNDVPSMNPHALQQIATDLVWCPELAGMEMLHTAGSRMNLAARIDDLAALMCEKLRCHKVIAVIDCFGEPPSIDAMVNLHGLCGKHFAVIVNVISNEYCKLCARSQEMRKICGDGPGAIHMAEDASRMVNARIDKYMVCDTI